MWIRMQDTEQYGRNMLSRLEAQTRSIETTTPLEAELVERLHHSFNGGRILMNGMLTLFDITAGLMGALGMMAGVSILMVCWRDRRYLQILDRLEKGRDDGN